MASVAWDVLVENELSAANFATAAASGTAVAAAAAARSDDATSREPKNKEHLAEARKALRHLRGRLPPTTTTTTTTTTTAAAAATAPPRERSPFSWIERRLNDENDLNEFEQMEHELGHTRNSPDPAAAAANDDDAAAAAAGPQSLVEKGDWTNNPVVADVAAVVVPERVPTTRSTSIAELGNEGGRSNPLREDNPPSALVQRFFKRSLQGKAQQAPTKEAAKECPSCGQLRATQQRLADVQRELSSAKNRADANADKEKNARRRCRELEKQLNEANKRLGGMGDDVQKERKTIDDERKRHVKQMRKQRLELDKHLKAHLPDRGIREKLEQSERLAAETKAKTDAAMAKARAEIQRLKREVEAVRAKNVEVAEDLRAAEHNRIEQWQLVERLQSDLVRTQQQLRHKTQTVVVPDDTPVCLRSSPDVEDDDHQQHQQQQHQQHRREQEEPVKPSVLEPQSFPQRIVQPGGKMETRFADGSRTVEFSNGTKKTIDADGNIDIAFANGDRKKIFGEREEYFYASSDILHVTYRDGIQVFHFANRQKETHYPDGSKEIVFADNIIKKVFANGDEESTFPNGLVQRVVNGKVSIEYPQPSAPSLRQESVERGVQMQSQFESWSADAIGGRASLQRPER